MRIIQYYTAWNCQLAWFRGSWMGLSAWTIVYARGRSRGHKKRSCTQSHSWTPFIHQFMMDHPSCAIILQIHTLTLPKIHEKPPFILPLSTFKSSCQIGDLLVMYHSKQGCALCVYIRLGAQQQMFMTHFEFFSITFSEILSYFSNKINQLKIINFKRVGLTFIKNNHTYF